MLEIDGFVFDEEEVLEPKQFINKIFDMFMNE